MAKSESTDEALGEENHPRRLGHHGFDLKTHGQIVDGILGEESRRHHSFMFSGSQGVGKATAAYHLAEGLFHHDKDKTLIRANTHPDVMVIEPDRSGKTTPVISVDQIRAMIPFLAHTPSRGGWRLVIIDAIDDMNLNGVNAMLKTLEEPPQKAIIIIISHGLKPILPTIRSRVQLVGFDPLSFDECRHVIERNFEDADQNWLDQMAALADGAPGKAQLLAESGVIELYLETCTLIGAGGGIPLKEIDRLSAQWGGKPNRKQLARVMMDRLLAQSARMATAKAPPSNHKIEAEEKAMTRLAKSHSAHHLAELHRRVLTDLDYAERVNLDMSPIMFKALQEMVA